MNTANLCQNQPINDKKFQPVAFHKPMKVARLGEESSWEDIMKQHHISECSLCHGISKSSRNAKKMLLLLVLMFKSSQDLPLFDFAKAPVVMSQME